MNSRLPQFQMASAAPPLAPGHLIIGICGPKGSGKDEAAKTLINRYGFIRLSFASFLKDACRAIFGLSDDQVNGDQKEVVDSRWGVTPRLIMQRVGTDLFRNQLGAAMPELTLVPDTTLWCHCMRLKIESFSARPEKIVITDVRFPDEEKLIRSLGGLVWRVDRPSQRSGADLHPSEMEQQAIVADDVIVNDGSLDELDSAVSRLMCEYYQPWNDRIVSELQKES